MQLPHMAHEATIKLARSFKVLGLLDPLGDLTLDLKHWYLRRGTILPRMSKLRCIGACKNDLVETGNMGHN